MIGKAIISATIFAAGFWLGWFLSSVDRGAELTAAYTLGVQETTALFKTTLAKP